MKLAHNVKVSVFVKTTSKFVESANQDLQKPGDDEEKIRETLLKLFPFDLKKEKIALLKTKADGFDHRKIIIYEVDLEKDRHINGFLEKLRKNLNDQQREPLVSQDNRIDNECCFYLRLDKDRLIQGEYRVTDSGNCFHIRISIAAFPKKKENARKLVKKMFS